MRRRCFFELGTRGLAVLVGFGPACGKVSLFGSTPERQAADGSVLAGLVRHPDGAIAPGVDVLVESADGWKSQQLESDAEGHFRARPPGEGPFRVTAISRGQSPVECELVTAQSVRAGVQDLELRLRATGSIEIAFLGVPDPRDVIVTAIDDEGFPAGSARNAVNRILRSCTEYEPTAEGTRIRGLEPGVYWIKSDDEDRSLASVCRVVVQEGKTTRIEVELVPATWLEVSTPCEEEPCIAELEIRTAAGYLDCGSFVDCLLTRGVYGERVLLPPGAYHVDLTTGEGNAAADVTLSGEPKRELRMKPD